MVGGGLATDPSEPSALYLIMISIGADHKLWPSIWNLNTKCFRLAQLPCVLSLLETEEDREIDGKNRDKNRKLYYPRNTKLVPLLLFNF